MESDEIAGLHLQAEHLIDQKAMLLLTPKANIFEFAAPDPAFLRLFEVLSDSLVRPGSRRFTLFDPWSAFLYSMPSPSINPRSPAFLSLDRCALAPRVSAALISRLFLMM